MGGLNVDSRAALSAALSSSALPDDDEMTTLTTWPSAPIVMRTVTSPWMFWSCAIDGYSGSTRWMNAESVISTGPAGAGGAVGASVAATVGTAVGTPFSLPTGGGVYACSTGPLF